MATLGFRATRARVANYFDATAMETWAKLTSDAPVSRIRQTVREGREQMRATLLSWLPEDLSRARLLDAGCGPGQFSIEAARRGAQVLGVDVAANLVDVARRRAAADLPSEASARLELRAGDMLDPSFGRFDHVVSMDVLIHYKAPDAVDALAQLAQRTNRSILFTFAPRTPALSVMHAAGKFFPKADRAPAIQPVSLTRLSGLIGKEPRLAAWRVARVEQVRKGFYMSHAVELTRR